MPANSLHIRARPARASRKRRELPIRSRQSIRRTIPADDLDGILDNIGLPYSGINISYTNYGIIGTADADILVSLNPSIISPPPTT